MTRTATVLTCLLLFGLAGPGAAQDPARLLREGINKETIGDCDGAIEDYRKVAAATDGALAAEARRRLAGCERKLGLGPDDVGQPLTRQLLADPTLVIGDVSPAGDLAVGMRDGAVVLVDLNQRSEVTLVAASSNETYSGPRISPDGRQVAFSVGGRGQAPQPVSLRVVDARSGAEPRTILRRPVSAGLGVHGWSPDATELLVMSGRRSGTGEPVPTQASWVAVADGAERIVRTFEIWQNPDFLSLSRDGRWIAFNDAPEPPGDQLEQHIFVMSADGGEPTAVVTMPGPNVHPRWTPDGSHLWFIGERSGPGLYSVAVANGLASANPTRVDAGAGMRRDLIAIDDSGALFHRKVTGDDFQVFVLDVTADGPVLADTFAGDGAVLSPDGANIAFLRYLQPRDGARARPFELTVRALDTGVERGYPIAGLDRSPIQWCPDGTCLLLHLAGNAQAGAASGGPSLLDLASGWLRPLVVHPGLGPWQSGPVVQSHDGSMLYTLLRRPGAVELVAVRLEDGATRSAGVLDGIVLPEAAAGPVMSISPDDSTIAILAPENPRRVHVWTAKVDGSAVAQLAEPGRYTRAAPAWSADGSSLWLGLQDGDALRVLRVSAGATVAAPERVMDTDLMALVEAGGHVRLRPNSGGSVQVAASGTRLVFGARTVPVNELWVLTGVPTAGR